MDVTTAVRRIKRQFGDEYDVLVIDDDIYGWIHEAELDIIRTTGCNDINISVAQSAFPSIVPLTVNILRVSINGKALQYITKDELDLIGVSDASVGEPSYWYRFNNQIYLYPQIASSQQVQITYNKVPAIMTGATSANTFTVPDVYHADLIKYCIAMAHNKNHDAQAEQMAMQMYDRNIGMRRDESQGLDSTLYKGNDPMDFNDFDGMY